MGFIGPLQILEESAKFIRKFFSANILQKEFGVFYMLEQG